MQIDFKLEHVFFDTFKFPPPYSPYEDIKFSRYSKKNVKSGGDVTQHKITTTLVLHIPAIYNLVLTTTWWESVVNKHKPC